VSGTGSAGMEAMVANLVRPDDRVVCGVHGLFGARMADELARHGADVVRVEGEWGRALDREVLTAAVAAGDTAALFVVHGETSTGVAQPLDGLADACCEAGALFLLDCVTSLAGHPLALDASGVDAAFSGTQKCLNAPPGLAPFTANARALKRVEDGRVASWYFDLSLVLAYWHDAGDPLAKAARAYHHTAPINLVYALAEALEIVQEEGLDARWARHATAHESLRLALAELGLDRLAPEGEQLHPLLAVRVPEGIAEATVRVPLLVEDGIEISGGLGPLAGRIWRIGVMGEGARPEAQHHLVVALARRLGQPPDAALAALADGWA
ncbi:MAG: aminotransferase class V-fold PLP-dependent enzyme, partial [Actinomycetota bacterium]|nr:aminotransferase class V-fold PLP-dependent enzyme [Actinomycetota bacterium]